MGPQNTSRHKQHSVDPTSEDKLQSRESSSRLDEEPNASQQPRDSEKGQGQSIRRRKGHRKSRNGCFTCKRARTKCNENHPSCDYCLHRGLRCEWPQPKVNQLEDLSHPKTVGKIENILQSSIPVFTMQDFRLFTHFIDGAYPHRPFRNASVWTHEIPSISSSFDYLLHSMLALSASSLATTQPQSVELTQTALVYRVKAIASLNAAISSGIHSFEEGNAMLATCYNLFVQSTLIDDGLVEFMTFIRGSIIISGQMVALDMKFLFSSTSGADNISTLNPALKNAPLIDPELVNAACSSLERLEHLCARKVEIEMFALLLNTARTLLTSSQQASMEARKIYSLFSCAMSHEDFREFTNPANEVARLLQSHFVALQLIMAPISKIALGEIASRYEGKGDEKSTVRWLGAMHVGIPTYLRQAYGWPMSVEQACRGSGLNEA